MRWLLVAAMVAGCGRLDFELHDASMLGGDAIDARVDAAIDATTAARTCTATGIPVDYSANGIVATRVVAAQVPDGYAFGLLMDGYSPLWGMHLDGQLVPSATTPFRTTPVGNAGYSTGSMFWDGVKLVGTLDNNDGTIYLKSFYQDMTSFNTAVLRTGSLGYPSVAKVADVDLSIWHSGQTLYYSVLAGDGQPTTDNSQGPFSANIVATSATSGPGEVAIAVQLANSSCQLVTISGTLAVAQDAPVAPCTSPSVVTFDNSYTFAYEVGTNVVAQRYGSPSVTIGAGTSPRPFVSGNEVLVAYLDGSSLKIARASDGSAVTLTGVPTTINAFDVAGDRVFAASGRTVYALNCP